MCRSKVELAFCASHRYHRGLRPQAYFFRDSHGSEVDLLLREAGALLPVEIKSGATFCAEFLKGLERFKGLGLERAGAGAVLYNGERRFELRGTRVFNPLRVENLWAELTGESPRN